MPISSARELFIQEVFKAASALQAAGRKINAAIVTAQAILESGYGESKLTKEAKNLFGIKAGSSWKGPVYPIKTKEYDKDGLPFYVVANFRKYSSFAECLADYATLIETRSWYRDAAVDHEDHVAYLRGILPDTKKREPGWATDPDYGPKILSLVNKFKLVAGAGK